MSERTCPGYVCYEILQGEEVVNRIAIPDTPLDWPEETDGR